MDIYTERVNMDEQVGSGKIFFNMNNPWEPDVVEMREAEEIILREKEFEEEQKVFESYKNLKENEYRASVYVLSEKIKKIIFTKIWLPVLPRVGDHIFKKIENPVVSKALNRDTFLFVVTEYSYMEHSVYVNGKDSRFDNSAASIGILIRSREM